MNSGTRNTLEISLNGYSVMNASVSPYLGCVSVVPESRAYVRLPDKIDELPVRVKIILKGMEDEFYVHQSDGVLYLDPINSHNVISFSPGGNMTDKSQHLGVMTRDFANKLATIAVNGSYAADSDLAPNLRRFVRDSGYEPLDEKIGYPEMHPLDNFIVYVSNGKTVVEDFQIIGQVNYREAIAGEKTIDVGMKKAVVYPFFVKNSK